MQKRRLFLGPVSAVGEKGKKQGQIGKNRRAKRALAVAWRGGKGLSPARTTSLLASLTDFFLLFSSMRSLVPR